MRNNGVINLFDLCMILCDIDDAVTIAEVVSRITLIDQQRLSLRSHEQRRGSSFDIDEALFQGHLCTMDMNLGKGILYYPAWQKVL